ncbi:hypothetical protein LMH87_012078 [Akanthomyces muscarius]|uniref:Uncharacterized protein n=1 Tax=Akanthomyces muscarius TaxID=2231603 RepID=A0A9W8QB30_AKAMU|nr:hypothetical protein LMH87_012078 [Akanthomyces muscarius]KAJ4151376.1 hypothetical protein LMH87_012078 [Akanthomyces muscarius]
MITLGRPGRIASLLGSIWGPHGDIRGDLFVTAETFMPALPCGVQSFVLGGWQAQRLMQIVQTNDARDARVWRDLYNQGKRAM